MSPAATSAGVSPTRSQIENWSTSHLTEAAATWRQAATGSESTFDEHRQNIASPGGTTWEGDAKDAAVDRVTADCAVVGRQGGVLREAADLAENGSHDINSAKDKAVQAITTAENDGFSVTENLKVTDARKYDFATIVERNRALAEHAEDIRWTAEQLVSTAALVGKRLQGKAVELEEIRFDGEGDGRDSTIRLVDHQFKLNPEDGEPDTEDGEGQPGGLPVPEQKKSIEGSRGTPQSKDILKPPDGRHEKPPPGTKVGGWGKDVKVGKPKGPLIAERKTGEHGAAVWDKVGGAKGPGGEYDWRLEVLGAHDQASAELRKDGAVGPAQGRASIAEGEGNATKNIGPVEVKTHVDGAIGARGNLGAALSPSGGQLSGDAAVGVHSSQKIEVNSHGIGVTGGVTEIAGAGAASDFHAGKTDDGKIAFGGHYGRAWGLGGAGLVEIIIDPKEVAGGLKELVNWFVK